jgi:hypothetical protein
LGWGFLGRVDAMAATGVPFDLFICASVEPNGRSNRWWPDEQPWNLVYYEISTGLSCKNLKSFVLKVHHIAILEKVSRLPHGGAWYTIDD